MGGACLHLQDGVVAGEPVDCCLAMNAEVQRESNQGRAVHHAGISGLSETEHAESFEGAVQQQAKQEPGLEENGVVPQAPSAPDSKHEVQQPEPKMVVPQPQQQAPINLYPNFPMPPEMHLGAGPAADAWQGGEHAEEGLLQQGRQLRQRSQQRAKGRKREHSPGWSPIGVQVQKRVRWGRNISL